MSKKQMQKDVFSGLYYNVLQNMDFCKTSTLKLIQIKKNLKDMLTGKYSKEIASLFMGKLSLLIYNTPEILPDYELQSIMNLFPVTTQLFIKIEKTNITIDFDAETIDLLKELVPEDDCSFKLIESHINLICEVYNKKYNTEMKCCV